MQGVGLALVAHIHVTERHVADHRVNPVCGQACVPEILDADIRLGVQRPRHASREAVLLDADEAHAVRRVPHEVPDPAPGFQHGGLAGNAQAGQGSVHRLDDRGGGVERGKGGAPRAGVFFRGQEGLQFLAELAPAVIGVGVFGLRARFGEHPQRHGAEAAEAGERLAFFRAGRTVFLLDLLEGLNGGKDVAGFALLAAGEGGYFHGRLLCFRCTVSRRTETLQASGRARAVKAQHGVWCGRGLDGARATGIFSGVCGDRRGKQRRLEGKDGRRQAGGRGGRGKTIAV